MSHAAYRRSMPLILVLSLVGCGGEGAGTSTERSSGSSSQTEPAPKAPVSPAGPGIMVSTLTSGGIAGVADLTQVTWDWKLITVRSLDGENEGIRRLTGDEQMKLRAILKQFHDLHITEARGTADGMSIEVAGVGNGSGDGSPEHMAALVELLQEFSKVHASKAD